MNDAHTMKNTQIFKSSLVSIREQHTGERERERRDCVCVSEKEKIHNVINRIYTSSSFCKEGKAGRHEREEKIVRSHLARSLARLFFGEAEKKVMLNEEEKKSQHSFYVSASLL
jgi:hypothetical protein